MVENSDSKTDVSRKRLTEDSAWSVLGAITNSLFGIVYLVVIGNYWGPDGLGLFALSLSIYLIGALICNVGIHIAVLYELAASGEDKQRASAFVYTALTGSTFFGICGAVMGFVLAPVLAKVFGDPKLNDLIRLFVFALPLFMVNKTLAGILNAHRRMRLIAIANMVRGAIILLYLLGAVILKVSLIAIPSGFILSETLLAIMLFTVCLRTHKVTGPSMQKSLRLISFGWKAALSGVIGDINTRLDILVVGIFWNPSIVGIYSVASAAAKGMLLVPGAIQRVTNPLIVQLYSSSENEKIHKTMDILLRLGTALFFILGFLMVIYIKPFINLVYPGRPEMINAAIPLYFLLPGIVIYSGTSMVGSAPSTSIGRPENTLRLISVAFLVNLLLNFLLVPFFAAAGAASATTISLMVSLVYFSWLCRKYLNFTMPATKLFLLMGIFCVLIFAVVMLENFVPRLVLLVAGLTAIIATIAALGMVHKSDWKLFHSIMKSLTEFR